MNCTSCFLRSAVSTRSTKPCTRQSAWLRTAGYDCKIARNRVQHMQPHGPMRHSISKSSGRLASSGLLVPTTGEGMAEGRKIEGGLHSTMNLNSPRAQSNRKALLAMMAALRAEEDTIRLGGGAKAVEAQHTKGRLTARERIKLLIDEGTELLELGLWAAHGMYAEFGGAPSAGVVTGLGRVSGRLCMIVANDATVKAGAFFPMTAKKVLRAQTIALENRIPTLYLVDSSGVFLPLQEDRSEE